MPQPPPDADREPDYRFTLANERTFLAWVRTALAMMAAAVAVVHLLPDLGPHGARLALGGLLTALALLISAAAYPQWRAVQRAMRTDRPLPRNLLVPVVALALVVVGVVALVTVFL